MRHYIYLLIFIFLGCTTSYEDFTVSLIIKNNPSLTINEIMFHPKEDYFPWVELYNPTKDIIDLSDYKFAIVYSTGRTSNPVPLCKYYLLPDTYCVISKDRTKINNEVKDYFLTLDKMPAIYKGGGTLVLLDNSDNIVETVKYGPKLHHPTLNNTENISLERIHYQTDSSITSSWHSASTIGQKSSPGYLNSQYYPIDNHINTIFHVENETLQFQISVPGWVADVSIWNKDGILVKDIAREVIMPHKGVFIWDGTFNNGKQANQGAYIYQVKMFHLNGDVKTFKRLFVHHNQGTGS